MDKADGTSGIQLDRTRFREVRRLAVYSLLNAGLVFVGELQRRFQLRPAEAQICLIVHTGSIQKVVRSPGIAAAHKAGEPLPLELLSGVSRRQIAAITGLSRAAVARTVEKLIARGLILEKSPGELVAPPGYLDEMEAIYPAEEMVVPILAAFDTFARLGVVKGRPWA